MIVAKSRLQSRFALLLKLFLADSGYGAEFAINQVFSNRCRRSLSFLKRVDAVVRNLNYWEISDAILMSDLDASAPDTMVPDMMDLPIQAQASKVPYVIQLLTVLHQKDQKSERSILTKLQSMNILSEESEQISAVNKKSAFSERFSFLNSKIDPDPNDLV